MIREEFEFTLLVSTISIYIAIAALTTSDVASPQEKFEAFDFIVVGAGVAGCVLASRLSEHGNHTVLLLEAGGYPDLPLNIPGYAPSYRPDKYVKRYATVPQRNVAGQKGGIVSFVTARVLGGNSEISGRHFSRGSPLDYDNWANLTGDPGWNYDNMLPYFKRVEDYQGQVPLTNQYEVDGPIGVSRLNYAPGLEEWLSVGRSLGYLLATSNESQKEGFTVPGNKRFGRSVSSYTRYIRPVMYKRRNLKILTHSKVRKILFERHSAGNIRASGVTFTKTSTQNKTSAVTVLAKKEVIVSAGVIGSPVLLLRSGIGPTQVLKKANVEAIKDLPVGENLHDHVYVKIHFIVRNPATAFGPGWDPNWNTWRPSYEIGDAPYPTTAGDTAQAFLTSSQASFSWPDLQLFTGWSRCQVGLVNQKDADDLYRQETRVACAIVLTRPKSRGSLTLNSTNADGDPVIDFRYLEDPHDMTALVEGIKKILTIFEGTTPHRKLGARYNPPILHGCRHLPYRSEEYWRCFIKQTGNSGLQAAGSCKMGAIGHPGTVVDSHLQAVGVSDLRVVDASVMPTVTNAGTQVPVYVIAEKASEIILQKWNNA